MARHKGSFSLTTDRQYLRRYLSTMPSQYLAAPLIASVAEQGMFVPAGPKRERRNTIGYKPVFRASLDKHDKINDNDNEDSMIMKDYVNALYKRGMKCPQFLWVFKLT